MIDRRRRWYLWAASAAALAVTLVGLWAAGRVPFVQERWAVVFPGAGYYNRHVVAPHPLIGLLFCLAGLVAHILIARRSPQSSSRGMAAVGVLHLVANLALMVVIVQATTVTYPSIQSVQTSLPLDVEAYWANWDEQFQAAITTLRVTPILSAATQLVFGVAVAIGIARARGRA